MTEEEVVAQIGAACQNVMGGFMAIAGAPDDVAVAEQANGALRELDALMRAVAGV
ncbi:hypothetical protein [Actinokineospora globicatena]|uniref:Uncharacterized protein n=1 Tax=Actinokineospora globicatena TaxID=103729 RepID=A0A9W6QJQ2_9PSEU|nr:hypothetical protein [Actinokineospora globicatena]GLW89935.1 hypothetical protein Aglo03_07510 [Actinokineospora globicatena]